MKKWLLKLKTIWKQNHRSGMLILLFLIILTVLLSLRTYVFIKTLLDADLTQTIEVVRTNQESLSKDIALKQQELLEKKKEYDTVLSSVLPNSISSGYVVQILDKLVLAVAQDITLTGITNWEDKKEQKDQYGVYPVEATFVLSIEALSKLLTLLSQAGTPDEKVNSIILSTGEKIMFPLITVEHITIEGDMGDQYDALGNKLKNQITAKLFLHFYSQSS